MRPVYFPTTISPSPPSDGSAPQAPPWVLILGKQETMVLQTCMTTVFTVDFPAQLIAHCLVSMLALQTSRAWLVFAYLSSEWLSLWCLFDEGPEPLPLRHAISFLWLSSYWISSSATRHPKSATCAFPLWYVFQTRKHYSVVWTYFFFSSPKFHHSSPFTHLITTLEGVAEVPRISEICKPEM